MNQIFKLLNKFQKTYILKQKITDFKKVALCKIEYYNYIDPISILYPSKFTLLKIISKCKNIKI
jgi:hypothetical protein